MALTRYTQKIFGQNATSNLGQFGSAINNTKVTSTNVETLQSLAAYSNGWESAIITNKNYPTWQERNGLDYGFSYQLAYLFENGIPEYDDGTEYKTSSIVRKTGTYQLYGSLVDENVGNLLSDTTKWTLLTDLSSSPIKTGTILHFATNTSPSGWLICNGANISRTSYSDLFNVIGTTYGAGDGSTTFTLPNLINRYVKGNTSVGSYSSASTATTSEVDNHTHNSWQYVGDWSASSGAGKHTHTYTKGVDDITLLPCIKY